MEDRMPSLGIIVVDDDPSICSFLRAAFTAEGHRCDAFLRGADAEAHLRNHLADLAMLDVFLTGENGIDLLSRLRALQADLQAVVMTAHVQLDSAARSVADGAVDYLAKPIEIEQLRELCRKAAESKRWASATDAAEVAPGASSAIVGRSPRMLAVFKDIGRVACSNVNVLVTGASGTGKELVARSIHAHSRRKDGPFIT